MLSSGYTRQSKSVFSFNLPNMFTDSMFIYLYSIQTRSSTNHHVILYLLLFSIVHITSIDPNQRLQSLYFLHSSETDSHN